MSREPQILIGTSGWSYRNWRKLFYPEDCPPKNWLNYYSSIFDTVELNATFYHRFSPLSYQNWFKATPKKFQFVIKLPGYITHQKRLIEVNKLIKQEEKSVKYLKSKFALFLMQLPPRIAYEPNRLQRALSAFTSPKKVVVEFRNSNWFTEEVREILRKYKAIFCNLDSPDFHISNELTSSTAYIRLHGHDSLFDYNYTTKELRKIGDNSQRLIDLGAKQVYIMFNNDMHAYAPRNAEKLKLILNLS